MSHNLNYQNGRYSGAFATDKNGLPWHKLGQMVKGAMTWQEAMKKAQLDWIVTKHPLYMKDPSYNGNGGQKGFQVPGAYSICRSDVEGEKSVLGVVGEQYTPVQNGYMFDFIDNVLESIDGAHYESAGVLGNGERVWALARVPFDFSVGKDKHETYLLFEGSHDGSKSCTVTLTDVRVVCQNTLNFALNAGQFKAIKVKHTKNAERKLEEVKKLWSGVKQNVKTIQEKFDKLIKAKINKTTFSATMKKLFGDDWQDSTRKQNNALEIARIFDRNDNNAYPEQRGTAYNLLNAVTNYVDHDRTARVTQGKAHYTEDMARADSSLCGSGAVMKTKALDTLLELVENAPTEKETTKTDNRAIDRILDRVNC